MSGSGGVQHDLPCTPQCPGGMQVLEGGQVAADHLFSIADDTLQSAPAFDGSSSVPDGDGGGYSGKSIPKGKKIRPSHHSLQTFGPLQSAASHPPPCVSTGERARVTRSCHTGI
ncbi:unnamed protein product [Arctogadus glacialis]